MASSTAIGSASVVLSANADGLAAGLDAAERKVKDFAGDVGRKLDKVGGSGGGGIIGKILGGAALGGAAGAAAGAVAGGVMKGLELLQGIPDLIRGLAEKATGPTAGPLRGIVAGMDRIGDRAAQIGGRLFASMGPAFLALADGAAILADRAGELADKFGSGVAAALSVGIELTADFLDGTLEVVSGITKWVLGLDGLSDTSASVAKVVFDFFRVVGKASAYTWDTFSLGAGAIGWVAGKIVEGLGRAVQAFGEVIRLAESLPAAIRPAWLTDFSRAAEQAGQGLRGVGDGLSQWGASAVAGFGQSAAQVDRWMDGVEQRFASRNRNLAALAEGMRPTEAKLGGALLKGSAEATSVVAKFQAQGMVNAADPARKQLAVMEEVKRLLQSIDRGLQNAPLLRAI
jgi:hypothetical protein